MGVHTLGVLAPALGSGRKRESPPAFSSVCLETSCVRTVVHVGDTYT